MAEPGEKNTPDVGKENTVHIFEVKQLPLTKAEWKVFLDTYAKEVNFTGDAENAALLLANFVKGMSWAERQFKKSGAKERAFPKLALTDENFPKPKDISGAAGTLSDVFPAWVVINTAYLSDRSRVPPENEYTLRDEKGNVGHVGTLIDYFILTGIEEFHHAMIFKPFNLTRGKKLTPLTHSDLHVYEAYDLEYLALAMQIKYAKEHNLRPKTIKVLENLLDLAYEERKRHGVK